ncbi:MAG: DUF401 family protein [Enterocloster asparagiformis]|nr:DUF401 family protein [Enterocloster asparagiformis]
MDILIVKLCAVFLVIIAILWCKRPLFAAISGGLAAAVLLYGIPVLQALAIMGKSLISPGTITVVLSFYFITFLQRMLERRRRLKQAEESLDGLFNNRRINASAAPAVIGLLPSAGAMTICAQIVKSSCEDYMSPEDMTCVTSFYRHIPESFLPTYSSILIALALSGVGAGQFVLAMLPLVAALFLIGYVFHLRRLPKRTGQRPEGRKIDFVRGLFRSLWSIILIVFLIIAFDIPVYIATPLVTVLNVFVDRLEWWEIRPMFITAFEPVIICNTVLIMMFKDIITSTGVIHELPVFFGGLPVPLPLVFALIFFFGTIISGSNAIIPLCLPMAMAAVPDGGVALLVLLMSMAYAAMQISPTHVCLFIASECFKVNIGALVRRNIPMVLVFSAVAVAYSAALGVFS